jgi:hypothetical protein
LSEDPLLLICERLPLGLVLLAIGPPFAPAPFSLFMLDPDLPGLVELPRPDPLVVLGLE